MCWTHWTHWGELTTLRDGPTLEATGIPAADSGSGNPKGQQPPGLCLVLAHLARWFISTPDAFRPFYAFHELGAWRLERCWGSVAPERLHRALGAKRLKRAEASKLLVAPLTSQHPTMARRSQRKRDHCQRDPIVLRIRWRESRELLWFGMPAYASLFVDSPGLRSICHYVFRLFLDASWSAHHKPSCVLEVLVCSPLPAPDAKLAHLSWIAHVIAQYHQHIQHQTKHNLLGDTWLPIGSKTIRSGKPTPSTPVFSLIHLALWIWTDCCKRDLQLVDIGWFIYWLPIIQYSMPLTSHSF